MKIHDGWRVITKDLNRTIIFDDQQVIIKISIKEIEELYKKTKESVKYWKKHNKEKSKKVLAIKYFFKHLNKNTSFFVRLK